jgi:hypothetical protein
MIEEMPGCTMWLCFIKSTQKDGSQFMPLHLAIHQADVAGCGFWNRLHCSKTDKPPRRKLGGTRAALETR